MVNGLNALATIFIIVGFFLSLYAWSFYSLFYGILLFMVILFLIAVLFSFSEIIEQLNKIIKKIAPGE